MPGEFDDIRQRLETIAEELADRIRILILGGTFPPGQRLPSERHLTERFGVSRGSVRDALRMLEIIGLLETRHGQVEPPPAQPSDALALRQQCAGRGTAAQDEELGAHQRDMTQHKGQARGDFGRGRLAVLPCRRP